MNDQTRVFLKQKFREYYSENPVYPPPELPDREWGFILFDETPGVAMRRHKSFNTVGELSDYLSGMAPRHAYHSTAYYTHPAAPTMVEKKWQGADLIFDLDADHLPGNFNSYSEMLENVKKEIIRLIDEFLIDDMGFREKDMDIVFSGGRGYHVHIRDEKVRSLKSPERREIVDYVLGTGLDPENMFVRSRMTGIWRIRGFDDDKKGSYGWNMRVARYIASKLQEIGKMPEKEARENLRRFGLDKNLKKVLEMARNPESYETILNKGLIELSPGNMENFFKNMLAGTIDDFKVDLAGKTDEPVTADIKRLIRLPGSIHGGSAFRVTPLVRDRLETFNPLNDAIIFSDSPVRVLVTKPQQVEIKDKVYRVSEGVGRLPENVAMFLMCRGCAEYEP
ncbi:DNA primase catalytic subunit PriS [Methanocella sp. CWC-04]|uniref:DNA primase small subunit PriS n=1 Tax=Methanooceanicella nereidis TaxID=2052831 RepID=A0AAP2W562_9EURY|nr:DNA primase catalytic subunit PriS [Methanocella sp. CWC-04]MCD1293832.1 DNA primase catalytic subunit PriS [Methanocella sp. CWC-04]